MPTQEIQRDKDHATTETTPVSNRVAAIFAAFRKIFGKPEHTREVSHRGTWELVVCIEPDELDGGFVAECVDLPGAMAQGETEEEAFENLIDAIQGVIAVRMEEQVKSIDFKMAPVGTQKPGRRVSVAF
jgi:predicted RNase H-like HicB family nuclease